MVEARCFSRPAVLLPAYGKRSVAQPLFCMRSVHATPRPRVGQPLRWSHGLWRAPGSQNWQIGLLGTGGLVGSGASAYGAFDSSAPRPGPGGAGRGGLATQRSWTPLFLESYVTLGLSSSSTHDTLATSSAILCFGLLANL